TGVLAIGTGYAVAHILGSNGLPFPQNFAMLAALFGVGAVVSLAALALLREPEGMVDQAGEKPMFLVYLRRAPQMLRENRQVRLLIMCRILIDGGGMAAPFYVLFARRDLHTSLAMVGIFMVLQS